MSPVRLYAYVGPPEIRARWSDRPAGRAVHHPQHVIDWIESDHPTPDHDGWYVATFVVDAHGVLRIEDYGYEHVACAGGGSVRAAGVLWFEVEGEQVTVAAATNQSTGFCPDPACWSALADALDAAGIAHPGGWTQAFVFRRCPACGQRNLVKDDWYVCGICGADLPEHWNFEP